MDNRPSVKVVFCCHPGIYASLVLTELLQSAQVKIVGVVMSSRLIRKDSHLLLDIPKLLKTTGVRYSCYQGLITLGHSLLSGLNKLPTISALCRKYQIPVLHTLDINEPKGAAFVAGWSPDYLLTTNFNQKLAAEVLALPAKGCINLHPSLLPDYKGVDPVLAVLAEGERQYGITLHQMDEDFDTGAILAQQVLPINPQQCLFWHNIQAFKSGALMARNYLETGGEGYTGREQQGQGRYFGWPSREQVSKVKKLTRLKNLIL